jgi:hypothetical protein
MKSDQSPEGLLRDAGLQVNDVRTGKIALHLLYAAQTDDSLQVVHFSRPIGSIGIPQRRGSPTKNYEASLMVSAAVPFFMLHRRFKPQHDHS